MSWRRFDCNNITYCNLRGTICPSEEGHEFEDPVFVRPGSWINTTDPGVAAEPGAPNTVWGQGDYHLGTASPWLDAGDPNYAAGPDETALDGNRRRADAAVDLGAYESEALVPVYRFSAAGTADHLFTVREAEKDQLISQEADVWTFEGPAFYAYTRASEPNLLPVYGLRSDKLGSHFYTINEAEKDKLIRQDAGVWTLEGTAFYAYPEGRQTAGTKAVHRFRSDALGSYFYTMNEAEKDKLIGQSSPVWFYEGVAWYAYETPGTQRSGPNGMVYELSGGSREARCTLSLKAYLDGQEVQIDHPEVNYTADHTDMRMIVDSAALTATLNEFLVETRVLEHAAAIGGNDSDRIPIPLVLSTSVLFWGRTVRGPFGIDSQKLTFPTTGSGNLPGGSETFTVGGSVTVDGNKLDVRPRAESHPLRDRRPGDLRHRGPAGSAERTHGRDTPVVPPAAGPPSGDDGPGQRAPALRNLRPRANDGRLARTAVSLRLSAAATGVSFPPVAAAQPQRTKPSLAGSHIEISGMKVHSSSVTIMATKNGRMGRITLVTVVSAMPQPRNRHVPTGGVHRPMHRFMIMMMPKWSGCTPTFSTTGRKIGVKISTAGVMSMKQPTTSRMALISSSRTTLLLVQPTRAALMSCGTFSEARTQDIAMLVAISRNTTEVVTPHLEQELGQVADLHLAVDHDRQDERVEHGDGGGLRGREPAQQDAADDDEDQQQRRDRPQEADQALAEGESSRPCRSCSGRRRRR